MNTATWMKDIPDTKWLRQMVMPGSHDAGVYGTHHTIVRASKFVKPTYVVCQHSDFFKQALAGSRFFDCRVFLRKVGRDQYENRLGHFAMEKVKGSKQPTLGGFGGTLDAVLGQALDFVLSNNSEFIILRFSHTFHPAECVKQIREFLKADPNFPRYSNALYKTAGNLAIKKIGELRGKVIMVFDESTFHQITPTEGFHRFKKYKEGSGKIDGLATCGVFSSSKDMAKVHSGAEKAVQKHLEHPGDADLAHLHFVYWQQTAGMFGEKDVYKTTSAPKQGGKQWTGGAHANLGDFTDEIRGMGLRNKMAVNVISHDFVTANTCEQIIKLNPEYA